MAININIEKQFKFLKSRWVLFFAILLLWSVDLISKWKFNGLMFGLDYGLYQPDGTLYTFRTLNWLGHADSESARLVSDWYSTHSFKMKNIDPSSLYYQVNSQWNRFLPRLVYPALSLPFVAMFGIKGMLFIPALSMLCLMVSILFIGIHYKQELIALCIAALLSFSITVNRWMFINTTDSVLVALSALSVLLLIKNRTQSKTWWVGLAVLIVTSGFTRVSVLEWLAISLVLFLRRERIKSIFIAVIASIVFIPAIYKNTSSAILPNERQSGFIEKMIAYPKTFIRVGFYEIAELAVLDRLLLMFLLVALVFSIFSWRAFSSQVFIAEIFALWVTGAVNGTIGVNFRYQLPLVVFGAWALIDYAVHFRLVSNSSYQS